MTTPPRALDIEREIADQQIPISAQGVYRKALSGNRPAAVKAMCLACQGWEDGARQAVRDCPSVGCPLHAVRPFQKKTGSSVILEIDESDGEGGEVIDLMEAVRNSVKLADPRQDDLDSAKSQILDHLHRHGESQRGYIIFSTGIPESMWSEAIRTLLVDGEVERDGEKRNTRYRLKEKP